MKRSEYHKKSIYLLVVMGVCLLLLSLSAPKLASLTESFLSKPIAEKFNLIFLIALIGGVGGYFMSKINALNLEWKSQKAAPNIISVEETTSQDAISAEEEDEFKWRKYSIYSVTAVLIVAIIATGDIYTEKSSHFYTQLYSVFFVPSLVLVTAFLKIKLKIF